MTSTMARKAGPKAPEFVGAKAALFSGNAVLTYLRDDRPDLPWADHWDLPGGGREGSESPEACLLRELYEEFGLQLSPDRLIWRRAFPSIAAPASLAVFFGGWLHEAEIIGIRFGDEGQGWRLMPVKAFLSHSRAVPEMQRRAGIVWADLVSSAGR
jgi:8-oxo-dGTP diphosphatase